MIIDISALRDDYRHAELDEKQVLPDPFAQFEIWLTNAIESKFKEPTAMALATGTRDGLPSVRMVLLKGFDQRGFVFFTNYESRKGRELAQNPRAALCFYWAELERQVRVTGDVEQTTRGESATYFDSRPPKSRVSAAASPQSQVVSGRHELEQAVSTLTAEYPNGDVPLPEAWGGYRLNPNAIEFWQGRRDRLHDRILYRRAESGWTIERLAP